MKYMYIWMDGWTDACMHAFMYVYTVHLCSNSKIGLAVCLLYTYLCHPFLLS
jgi:hypothetical protein